MMKRGMRTIAAIIALSLAIAAFLQPLQVLAVFTSEKYQNSRYFDMDKEVYTKYGSYGDVSEWTKCGNYYYEKFSFPGSHYITIRRVEEAALKDGVLTIPSELDGYRVIGVGAFNVKIKPGSMQTELEGSGCILEKPELLLEVVFPEGIEVIGQESFSRCHNLKQIHFPESLVYIAPYSFYGCMDVSELSFPQGVVLDNDIFHELQAKKITVYSNTRCEIAPNNINNRKIKSELYIKYYERGTYYYYLKGYFDKLYISPGISEFDLSGEYYRDSDSQKYIPCFELNKLIVNAKSMKLSMSSVMNLSGIYTVKGAKAIREAREHNIPYYIKKTGKTQNVKGKKKAGQYRASWKKVKTEIERHAEINNWKGKILKKKVKTRYKVYGRSKKTDYYKKIGTTDKNSFKSKYKYIKVVPAKEWD